MPSSEIDTSSCDLYDFSAGGHTVAARTPNRWRSALAGVVMQIALGAVYAWSVFRIPLTNAFAWTIPQVTLTFTIAIFVLGFAAFVGGIWMRRSGPRVVALTAGVLGRDVNGDDYTQLPTGNLDVTGRYFIWTTNIGGDRLDAFVVKVPYQWLLP